MRILYLLPLVVIITGCSGNDIRNNNTSNDLPNILKELCSEAAISEKFDFPQLELKGVGKITKESQKGVAKYECQIQ